MGRFFLAAIFLFTVAAAAQHSGHHPPQTDRRADSKASADVTAHHQEMQELVHRLLESVAALENEKDLDAIKSKLSEHRRVLEQLQDEISRCSERMTKTSQQGRHLCRMGSGHKH